MVKIVIFVTILALACVNAQFGLLNQGPMMGGIFDNPLFKKFNFQIPDPKDFIADISKIKPGSGRDVHSSFVSQISKNGKVITTLETNDNGKKDGFTVIN